MIEFLTALTLFGSTVVAVILLLLFIVGLFYSDIIGNGFVASIYLVIVVAVVYFWGNDAWQAFLTVFTTTNVVTYVAIGIGFSLIRGIFFGRKQGKILIKEHHWYSHDYALSDEQKKLPKADRDKLVEEKKAEAWKKYKADGLKSILRKISGNVARWLFMWPVSALVWGFTDVFREVWDLIWHRGLKHIYNALVTWGFNSVMNEKSEK